MSALLTNSFTSWALTPEELEAGSKLSELQRQVIQNMISEFAEQKIALLFDPQNPMQFAQLEAELQGKIGILKHLLAQSDYYSAVSHPSL